MSTFQKTSGTKQWNHWYILTRRFQQHQLCLDPHADLSAAPAGLAEVPICIAQTRGLCRQSTGSGEAEGQQIVWAIGRTRLAIT